ncbi:MAG: hypothetical protein BWY64_02029 [bacterium ADurb.Bin363]|nr:MAG: hypothetical protein BWY64_02029 [bacterium ADurb.Bin363]
MKKQDKVILILCSYSVFLLVSGTFAGFLLYPLFNKPVTQIILPPPTPAPSLIVPEEEVIKIQDFDRGDRWKLFADSFMMNKEKSQGSLDNVTCCFYETNKLMMVIESDHVSLNFYEKIVIFDSRVRAVSSKGIILGVDKLTLKEKTNESYGEGNVILLQGNNIVRSDKIKADLYLQTYNMIGNIKMLKTRIRRADFASDMNQ